MGNHYFSADAREHTKYLEEGLTKAETSPIIHTGIGKNFSHESD